MSSLETVVGLQAELPTEIKVSLFGQARLRVQVDPGIGLNLFRPNPSILRAVIIAEKKSPEPIKNPAYEHLLRNTDFLSRLDRLSMRIIALELVRFRFRPWIRIETGFEFEGESRDSLIIDGVCTHDWLNKSPRGQVRAKSCLSYAITTGSGRYRCYVSPQSDIRIQIPNIHQQFLAFTECQISVDPLELII